MMINYMKAYKVAFYNSDKPDKRFQAIFFDEDGKRKTIHFGQKDPKRGTYIDHQDDDIKKAYIARHKVNEDWLNPMTAGSLSRFILWNKPTLRESIIDFRKRFNLDKV